MVADARLDARNAALAEAESLRIQALSIIAQSIIETAPAVMQIVQTHRTQAAELALAAAVNLAGAAFQRLPTGAAETAIEALSQEIDVSPRLVIRMSGLDDANRERLQAAAADAGYQGLIAFREEPGLHPAAFELEWADGRAAFDPADAAARMGEALASALASETGHAERLTEGRAG